MSLFVVCAVSGLAAAGLAAPAGAATTPAVATVLVGDNVGDGGPAATAQASSSVVARETNGSIVFFDELTQQLRIDNPATGLVTVLYGHKHSPEIKYSVPPPTEGADAVTLDLRDPARLWVDNANNVYLTFDYEGHLWRIDHATHKFHLMLQGYDVPDEYHLVQYVQVVRHDGSVLVDFARTDPTTGDRPHVTTWIPANATYLTVPQSFAPHTMPQATEDAAGNLYYVQGAGIWRRTPAGAESLVAGVDTDAIPDNNAPRAEGVNSLGATMNPYDLHATPDGHLVYTEPLDPDATHGARTRVRIATVGGTVHNVVNPAGTGSDTAGPLTQYGLAWFATDNNQLIDGGEGAVRSWQLDGSQADSRGTLLVGLNDLGGPVSSPDGTPTSLAAVVTAGDIGVDPRDGSVVLPQPEDIRVVRHSASGDHLYRWGGGGNPADGVGDGLPATQAEMRSGTVRFAADGTAYVLTADGPQAHPEWRVRKVATNGVVSTVVGGGSSPLTEGASLTDVALPSDSMAGAPFALSPDGHSLLVAFGETAKIWQFDLVTGIAHRLSGTGGSTPAVGTSLAAASIFQAYWVGYDPAGHVLVDDGTTLWKVDDAGLLQDGPALGGAYERVFLADGSIVTNFGPRLDLTTPGGQTSTILGQDPSDGSTIVRAIRSGTIADAGNGVVYISDSSGATAAVLSVKLPGTDSTPPVVSLTTPTLTLSTSAAFTWHATDAGGIGSYDARWRSAAWGKAYGAWQSPASWTATTATTRSVTASAGSEVCAEVRARDVYGNTSAWSAAHCTTLAVDDRALVASGAGISRDTGTSADMAKTVTRLTKSGTSLSSHTAGTGRTVSVIGESVVGGGSVKVYVGTHLVGTASFARSTGQPALHGVVRAFVLSSTTTGVMKLVSASTKPVRIDAVAFTR